ncbi:MAG: hypothetical protein ACREO0_15040 [Pseudoxanthomonas sp.]
MAHNAYSNYSGVELRRALSLIKLLEDRGVLIDGELRGLFPELDLVMWARSKSRRLEPEEIQRFCKVSRATVYRYLSFLPVGRQTEGDLQV